MELKPTTNEKWKLLALASLFCWFTIFLFLNKNNTILILSSSTRSTFREPLMDTVKVNSNFQKPYNFTSTSFKNANNFGVINQSSNRTNENTTKKCDMFDGIWVYKQEEKSRYDSIRCPFIEEKFSCQKNGRPDSNYEKWSWEAKHCVIPSFDARDMLEKLRNKRVIIVGDSLNRNMWESLSCLLYSSLPTSKMEIQARNMHYKVLKAKDYNCIVEFYWSPFLVELNEKHEKGKKVLIIDKMSPNSEQWRGADVMVFNTGFWWTHTGKMKAWDLFQYKGKLIKEMKIEEAFKNSMQTWATWIEKNVDTKRTRVVFRSISTLHNARPWCFNVTQPLMAETYETFFPKSMIDIIEGMINNLRKSHSMTYLNITALSRYRVDAHPSLYKTKKWMLYAKESQRFLESYIDCSHWCLPGLPDTWNRLLYALVFLNY